MVESAIAKLCKGIKDKVLEKVGAKCEDALQQSYLDTDEGLKPAMFNIVEHTLTGVVCGSCCHVLGGMELAFFIQKQLVVENTIRPVLTRTGSIVPVG